jgi:transcriptional regulator with XRE-family HTH domain
MFTNAVLRRGGRVATFKERFMFLKVEKDVTLEEIAKAVGSNKASLSRFVSGSLNIKKDMIEALANYFDVDQAFLLGESDIRKQSDVKYTPLPEDLKYFKKEFSQSTITLVKSLEEFHLTPDQARIVLKGYVESMKKLKELNDKKDSE